MCSSRRCRVLGAGTFALALVAFAGCELISNHLSKWKMLDQRAMEDPIAAVGGDAIVFAPAEDRFVRLAKATQPTWWRTTPP
jgi:hypothetical protein